MEAVKIKSKIVTVRNQAVLLDFDLAALYEVETKVLKQAVRRNIERFPEDFMFELTNDEVDSLRSQIVTLKTKGRGKHSKYAPFAFTEQGVAMLSTVLRSKKAIEVNIDIMRAFVYMRQYAVSHKDISDRLAKLEAKYDKQFNSVYDAIKFLMQKNASESAQKDRKQIGYKK